MPSISIPFLTERFHLPSSQLVYRPLCRHLESKRRASERNDLSSFFKYADEGFVRVWVSFFEAFLRKVEALAPCRRAWRCVFVDFYLFLFIWVLSRLGSVIPMFVTVGSGWLACGLWALEEVCCLWIDGSEDWVWEICLVLFRRSRMTRICSGLVEFVVFLKKKNRFFYVATAVFAYARRYWEYRFCFNFFLFVFGYCCFGFFSLVPVNIWKDEATLFGNRRNKLSWLWRFTFGNSFYVLSWVFPYFLDPYPGMVSAFSTW